MKRILPPGHSRNATIQRIRYIKTHRPVIPITPLITGAGSHNRSTSEEVTMRRAEVLRMRSKGISTVKIAEKFRVSPKTIWRDLKLVLKRDARCSVKNLQVMRQLEIARLDDANEAIYDKVLDGSLGAIDALIQLSRRRSMFLGLDAEKSTPTTGEALPWSDTDEPPPWGMSSIPGPPEDEDDDEVDDDDEDDED